MSSSLKLTQLFQVEEVRYLLCPPPVWLAFHLTEEGQSLLSYRLRWRPGRNAAGQRMWLMPRTTTRLWQQLLLWDSRKVSNVFFFFYFTLASIFSTLNYFSLPLPPGTNPHLGGSGELNQNSEVAQTCDGKTEQVCVLGNRPKMNLGGIYWLLSLSRKLLPVGRRRMMVVVVLQLLLSQIPMRK